MAQWGPESRVIAGTCMVLTALMAWDGFKEYKRRSKYEKERNEIELSQSDIDPVSGTHLMELALEKPDNQEILRFLYLIAEDQAKRTGYIHRGVSCNCCGQSPIKGTRYRCSECADVDLCQKCESAKRHAPEHILLKIKVPIPLVRSPRWVRESYIPLSSRISIYQHEECPEELILTLASRLQTSVYSISQLHKRFRIYADTCLNPVISKLPYGISSISLRQALVPHDSESPFAYAVLKAYDPEGHDFVRFEDYVEAVVKITERTGRSSSELVKMAFKSCETSTGSNTITPESVLEVRLSFFHFLKYLIADMPMGTGDEMGIVISQLGLSRPISSAFTHGDLQRHIAQEPIDLGNMPPLVQPLNDKLNETASQQDPILRKAYGPRANRDLDDRIRIQVTQEIEAFWREMQWQPGQRVVLSTTAFDPNNHIPRKHPHNPPLTDWLTYIIL